MGNKTFVWIFILAAALAGSYLLYANLNSDQNSPPGVAGPIDGPMGSSSGPVDGQPAPAEEGLEGEADYSDLIRVSAPLPNQKVTSPLTVRGTARGTWYFEASFPVKIFDADGRELGVTPAQAQSDWMTTEFVPFEAVLTFEKPRAATGTLVLMKDNPSGLPENDDSISIPVRF